MQHSQSSTTSGKKVIPENSIKMVTNVKRQFNFKLHNTRMKSTGPKTAGQTLNTDQSLQTSVN